MALPAAPVYDLNPAHFAGVLGDPVSVDENTLFTVDGLEYFWWVGSQNFLPNPGPNQDLGWAAKAGSPVVTLTLDATVARRPGKSSRKVVRGAVDPSTVVCQIDGLGAKAGGTVTLPSSTAPRYSVYLYTEETGLSAQLVGLHASATMPIVALVPGEWTRVETFYTGASLTSLPVYLNVTSASPTVGGETVWICDAMCSKFQLYDFLDGDTPGGVWLGVPGDSASEGAVTFEQRNGHKEFVSGGMSYFGTNFSYALGAAVTVAAVVWPRDISQIAWLAEIQVSNDVRIAFQPGATVGEYGPTLSDGSANLASSTGVFSQDAPIMFIGTSTTGDQDAWVNGVLNQSTAYPHAAAATTSTQFAMSGAVRRFIVWDRVLTAQEILDVEAELVGYLQPIADVSWDVPAHDGGSPLTGYLVRVYDGAALVETAVAAGVTTATVQVPSGSAVQVVALNAVGMGRPTEVGA